MSEILGFWVASSMVLFLLSFVYFHQGFHRKNALFAWWLSLGVSMQIVSAIGMMLAFPVWLYKLWPLADGVSLALALAVVVVAFLRRTCAVNQVLLYGLGAMLALNVVARWGGARLGESLQSWLQNIAFFGPAIFLVLAFSNVRADRLPLFIDSVLRAFNSNPPVSHGLAFGTASKGAASRAA